ncbi:ECF transporter S component [Levilactobacillus bambusae]|uniref:ABC transporter permease n=1 Tax=Levilactobacillus bambusae TaxID=2024736 RepID=A0A2V1MYN4_9LACO|nr:ECF transporter S component [Levilactobacillus bambusae]PWG00077.1 ABC transporter permease [Levilactobacillus bambusae]
MSHSSSWHLRSIILLALISLFFGVIFWVISPLYDVLTAILTPMGLAPFANEILIGVWCMAGPVAGYLLRIPVAAFLGEFIGAAVEMLLGSQWGASDLIAGAIQGVGSELGFTLTGYKRYNWGTLLLSAVTVTLVTFGWDMIKNGYGSYHLPLLLGLLAVRFLSNFFFGGVLTKAIVNLLDRAHVLGTGATPQN